MAKLFGLFKKDKGNKNDNEGDGRKTKEHPPNVDRHRLAFNTLAEECETNIVRNLARQQGTADDEMLQKLKDKKDKVSRAVFAYVNEMLEFCVKCMIEMCKKGNREWSGIPIRQEYAAKVGENPKYGEFNKVLLLLALNKVAEKGYEAVEKGRDLGAAKVLGYYLWQLDALLTDEYTIKYDTPLSMKEMFVTHVRPVFTEVKRFGIEVDSVVSVISWYTDNFREYVDLFKDATLRICDDETYAAIDRKLFGDFIMRVGSCGVLREG